MAFKFLLDNNVTSKHKLLVYLRCQVNETGNCAVHNADDTIRSFLKFQSIVSH